MCSLRISMGVRYFGWILTWYEGSKGAKIEKIKSDLDPTFYTSFDASQWADQEKILVWFDFIEFTCDIRA